MTQTWDDAAVNRAWSIATTRLLAAMRPAGWWEGRLSSSALATATAVSAFAVSACPADHALLSSAIAWLDRTQTSDGGWGDSPDSPANLSTTVLVVAAMRLAGVPSSPALTRASAWLSAHEAADPAHLVTALTRAYGNDRTFAVPILANAALAGLVPWDAVPPLPFELSILPPAFYRVVRLPVVSYALPALIAIGQLIEARGGRSRIRRSLSPTTRRLAMQRLATIQPASGGFLEAAPLTAFVAMSLADLYGPSHPAVRSCLDFLRRSARPDGSFPIDSNLSVWMTSSSVAALAAGRGSGNWPDGFNPSATAAWLTDRQSRQLHPYTQSPPGGWAWTHLPGGVPDGDDTSGALLALSHLAVGKGVPAGIAWLLRLQNRDGGWPTFCRGWGRLAFDRSSPDLTAHAIRALTATDQAPAVRRAVGRALRYLRASQQADGAWCPLWFGNQAVPGQANPVLGTARVLRALETAAPTDPAAERGLVYLLVSQNDDGGWGGDHAVPSTIEETALAIAALAGWRRRDDVQHALDRALPYIGARVFDGSWTTPSPIGLYFSSLWYSEQLYPLIWTVEALGRVVQSDYPQARSSAATVPVD